MKKLVVITGASSGIGEQTAKLFSSLGHPLLLLARRVEKLESLNLPNTLCKKVDVRDVESFKAAIVEAESKFGPVDLMVNNAGILLLGNVWEQELKEWQEMFDINVIGVINGIHAVINSMLDRNSGTIVNISSIAGRKTFPNHAGYCGTKFAIHAISENIRQEIASKNVRMVTIAPGVTETEVLNHTTKQELIDGYKSWKKEVVEESLSPIDIANAIEYAYKQPQNVCIREIVICPTKQDA